MQEEMTLLSGDKRLRISIKLAETAIGDETQARVMVVFLLPFMVMVVCLFMLMVMIVVVVVISSASLKKKEAESGQQIGQFFHSNIFLNSSSIFPTSIILASGSFFTPLRFPFGM